jgi:hypothetical protein
VTRWAPTSRQSWTSILMGWAVRGTRLCRARFFAVGALLPLLAIVPPPAPVVRDRGVPARGPGGVWAAQRPGGHATVRRAGERAARKAATRRLPGKIASQRAVPPDRSSRAASWLLITRFTAIGTRVWRVAAISAGFWHPPAP